MASANPDQDKFKEELNWCIEHLELKIPNVKCEKQVKDISKAISSLKNPKNPLPKKRQVMRVSCGNYREKMLQEDHNFKFSKSKFYKFGLKIAGRQTPALALLD